MQSIEQYLKQDRARPGPLRRNGRESQAYVARKSQSPVETAVRDKNSQDSEPVAQPEGTDGMGISFVNEEDCGYYGNATQPDFLIDSSSQQDRLPISPSCVMSSLLWAAKMRPRVLHLTPPYLTVVETSEPKIWSKQDEQHHIPMMLGPNRIVAGLNNCHCRQKQNASFEHISPTLDSCSPIYTKNLSGKRTRS